MIEEIDRKDDVLRTVLGSLHISMKRELLDGAVPVKEWTRIASILRLHAAGAYRLWIARLDNEIAGYCGLSPDGELAPAWIAPHFRRRGLHSEMIRVRSEAGGYWTTVRRTNEKSLASYRKHGFLREEPHDNEEFVKMFLGRQ